MSILRSKTISHFQIVLPRENAYRIIGQIGRIDDVELKGKLLIPNDMPFFLQSKLCEEQLERIKVIERQLHHQGHPLSKDNYSKDQYDAFLAIADRRYRMHNESHIHMLQTKTEELGTIWRNSEELKQRKKFLEEEFQLLHEELHILEGGKNLFGNKLYDPSSMEGYQLKKIGFRCGIVLKKDQLIIKRTIFRVTRGHSVLYTLQDEFVVQPKQQVGEKQSKDKRVFIYLFYGFGTSSIMQTKIRKLLQTYCIKIIDYPKSDQQLDRKMQQIRAQISENKKIQDLVQTQSKNVYNSLFQLVQSDQRIKFNQLEYYKLYFIYEKFIYEQLNQMKMEHSFAQTEIFIESQKVDEVTHELEQKLADDRMPIPQLIPILRSEKPTLFDLNEYTLTPYTILSAYGIPQYKQINPAIFNLVTFPFLFGVMFSDIAHGSIILGLGLLMILFPKKFQQSKIFKVLLPHRISIFLMGLFATYNGFIYNEFLSISLNIFGSCYSVDSGTAIPTSEQCVYPFGIDPVWSISQNKLQYTNSLKMKIAVIIAVVHMTVGIFLKAMNQLFQHKKRFILLETIPQIVFFVLLFGYMDFLIIFKWVNPWEPSLAPSIITTLINMPLKLGKTTDCCGGQPMWGDSSDNTSQNSIQLLFLLIAVLCLPLILCLKPIQIYRQHKKTVKNEAVIELQSQLRSSRFWENKNVNENLVEEDLSEGKIEMSEVIVHQIIETIEFALGCISNTASYLRLWALSLAHQQLSEVFFSETVERGLKIGYIGVPVNLILFPIFGGITFGILICMDSMECFLHTLRLHWVQFQNKFYKGDGRSFSSFQVRTLTNQWIEAHAISSDE